MSDYLMKTYSPHKIAFSHGEDCWLWDLSGKKYLDALSGIAVVNLGHNHHKITAVIKSQAQKLIQVSNCFEIPEQVALAKRLIKLSGLDKVFFCSTGSEANETAIKIIRLYGNVKGISIPNIVVMEKAFHGRTMASITASDGKDIQKGFEPLLSGFLRCPYDDIHALKVILSKHSNIVGVMLEPIQGAGGLNVPHDSYLSKIRSLCNHYGVLMILDEVQTGIGRTGEFFAYQHTGILPDIITLAKGLGNGYPVAACIARGEAADVFQVGKHGTTFGGSPLSSVIASTVIDTVSELKFLLHVQKTGQYLLKQLRNVLGHYESVVDIRGKGLMVGIELNRPCTILGTMGLKIPGIGLVLNVIAQKVIRIVPPLTINRSQVDILVLGLDQIISQWEKRK